MAVSHFATDAIVSHFCSLVLAPKALTRRESEIQQMVCAFLVDCASSETIECLHSLMELERHAKQQPQGQSSLSLWQVKLAVSGSKMCRSIKGFFAEGLRNFIDSNVTGAPSLTCYACSLTLTLLLYSLRLSIHRTEITLP